MGFFLQSHFEDLCLTLFFPSVFTSHSASSNSQVPEVSKNVLMFLMMSETQWTAAGRSLFLSKRSIVIKLPVSLIFLGNFLIYRQC